MMISLAREVFTNRLMININVHQDGLLNDCLMIDRRTMFRLLGWCVAYFTLPRGNSSAKAL